MVHSKMRENIADYFLILRRYVYCRVGSWHGKLFYNITTHIERLGSTCHIFCIRRRTQYALHPRMCQDDALVAAVPPQWPSRT